MTRAPDYQRKDSQTNHRLILRALDVPRSAQEIAAIVGVTCVTARSHLRVMLAAGEVHIARWIKRGRGTKERIFAAGAGKNAPKPKALTQAQRNAATRERQKTDPEAAFRRRKTVQAYHLRHRAPRSDPAAAWINSPGGNNV